MYDHLRNAARDVLDALPVLIGTKEGNITEAFMAVGVLKGIVEPDFIEDIDEAKDALLVGRVIEYPNSFSDDLRKWSRGTGRSFHKELTEPVGRVARAWLAPEGQER